jgi:hypothetical protein
MTTEPLEPATSAPAKDETRSATTKLAVVVVHGVGDPGGPGTTVDRFVNELANASTDADGAGAFSPTGVVEIHHVPQPGGDGASSDLPVHVRRGQMAGREVVVAEVYWADLSRQQEGTLGLLWALAYVVFDVRHVVRALIGPLPERTGEAARAARPLLYGLLTLAQLLVLGVAAPLVAVMAGLLLVRGIAWELYRDRYVGVPAYAGTWIAFLVALAAIGFGLAGWRLLWQPWVWFWRGLVFAGGLFVLLVCVQWHLTLAEKPFPAVAEAFTRLDRYVVKKAVPPNQDVDEYVEARSEEEPKPDEKGRIPIWKSQYQGFTRTASWYCSVLLEGIWWAIFALGCVLTAALAVALGSLLAGRTPHRTMAAWSAVALQGGLWIIFILTLQIVGTKISPEFDEPIIQRDPLVERGRVLGRHLVLGAVVGLSVLAVWWARARVRRGPKGSSPEAYPRLLFGPAIQACLAVTFFVGAVPFALVYFEAARAQIEWLDSYWGAVTAAFLTGFALFGWLLMPVVGNGLHVAMDAISHFHRRESDGKRFIHEEMQRRFVKVLTLVLRDGGVAEVLIVAHSQGSVIAFDALGGPNSPLGARRVGVTFVTMGSPLHHLYGHYFPRYYPPLADAEARARIEARLARWVNLYHADDYVGTQLAPWWGTAPAHWEDCDPTSGGGSGHTTYWSDGLVLRRILGLMAPAAPAG